MDVYDAAERYKKDGQNLIILAGRDYGSGKFIIILTIKLLMAHCFAV